MRGTKRGYEGDEWPSSKRQFGGSQFYTGNSTSVMEPLGGSVPGFPMDVQSIGAPYGYAGIGELSAPYVGSTGYEFSTPSAPSAQPYMGGGRGEARTRSLQSNEVIPIILSPLRDLYGRTHCPQYAPLWNCVQPKLQIASRDINDGSPLIYTPSMISNSLHPTNLRVGRQTKSPGTLAELQEAASKQCDMLYYCGVSRTPAKAGPVTGGISGPVQCHNYWMGSGVTEGVGFAALLLRTDGVSADDAPMYREWGRAHVNTADEILKCQTGEKLYNPTSNIVSGTATTYKYALVAVTEKQMLRYQTENPYVFAYFWRAGSIHEHSQVTRANNPVARAPLVFGVGSETSDDVGVNTGAAVDLCTLLVD